MSFGFGFGIPFARVLASVPGWSAPTGTDYPSRFSATLRGGLSSSAYIAGTYADGGLLTVKTAETNNWKSVRNPATISSGQKFSFQYTIQGSTKTSGVAIGNASATLESYTGSTANGYTFFHHVNQWYTNGSDVQTLAAVNIGSTYRVDIDRSGSGTVRIYDVTGGDWLGAALDISALGSGVWYVQGDTYSTTDQLAFDFGQTSFTVPSGFSRGPVGGWDVQSLSGQKLQLVPNDLTRLWKLNSDSTSVVTTAGDPVGYWLSRDMALNLNQGTAASRPEYTAAGIRFENSGGLKDVRNTYVRDLTLPFTAALLLKDVTGTGIIFASAAATGNGISPATTTKQRVGVRGTLTNLGADAAGAERFCLVTYDGTDAFALDADGTWSQIGVGATTGNSAVALMTAPPTSVTDCVVAGAILLEDSVTETEARNIKWWMEQNAP